MGHPDLVVVPATARCTIQSLTHHTRPSALTSNSGGGRSGPDLFLGSEEREAPDGASTQVVAMTSIFELPPGAYADHKLGVLNRDTLAPRHIRRAAILARPHHTDIRCEFTTNLVA